MPRKKNSVEWAFLFAITAAGAFLRFHRIGKECLWLDEIFSAWRVSLTFPNLTNDLTLKFLFPPLYFYFLKTWSHLFGPSTAALKSFSALWGTAAIPIIYLLAREMFGRRAAVISTILLAFSAFNIYYSQEVKMYAMWWTLVLASNLFFVRSIKYGMRWPDVSLFCVVTAAALWTHNFTVLVIGAQVIYLAAVFPPREVIKRWVWPCFAVVLLYCPWPLFFMTKNFARSRGGDVGGAMELTRKALEWIPIPTLREFFLSFVIFTSGIRFYAYDLDTWSLSWHMPFPAANYFCLMLLVILLYPVFHGGKDKWGFKSLIVVMVLFPSVGLFLYSRLVHSFWQPRYVGFISSILFIMLGYGYRLSSRKGIAASAVVALVVLNLSILDFYYSDRVKKPWDDLVVYLSPRVEGGDTVLFPHMYSRRTFMHYWDLDEKRREKILNLEFPFRKTGEVQEKVVNFDDVWLVLSYPVPRGGEARVRSLVEVHGYRRERMYLGNGLAVAHYMREK